jgi:hypothetical protein
LIVRCAEAPAEAPAVNAIPITVSDGALKHLKRLKADKGDTELLLRVGVRSGGCSGLSYAMDFESPDKVAADDAGIALLVHLKSTREHTIACLIIGTQDINTRSKIQCLCDH